jgi:hypothetical protein
VLEGVYPVEGWYVPLPEMVAVPMVVPPLAQVVGALACGPNTVNVIVPVAPLVAPDRVELIELVEIAVFVLSVAGADALVLGLAFATTVSAMPEPQALFDAALLASPP